MRSCQPFLTSELWGQGKQINVQPLTTSECKAERSVIKEAYKSDKVVNGVHQPSPGGLSGLCCGFKSGKHNYLPRLLCSMPQNVPSSQSLEIIQKPMSDLKAEKASHLH